MSVAPVPLNTSVHHGGLPPQQSALVVSVSGLRDSTLLDAARFVAALEKRDVSPSLLVAPHAGKDWSLRKAPAVLDWVRRRHEEGTEILLAGFDQSVRGRLGEFASLDSHEATLRLKAAQRQMYALGLETDMFAPPKWAMSHGTLQALPGLGFRIAADLHGVHDLDTGATDPTRVLALGEGFGAARWWRRAIRTSIDRAVSNNRPIRLSVSATRLRDSKIRDAAIEMVDRAIDNGARPTGYAMVPLRVAA